MGTGTFPRDGHAEARTDVPQRMLSTGDGCTILADDIVSEVHFELRAPCLPHSTRVLVNPPTTPRTRCRTTCDLSMVVRPLALRLHKYWSPIAVNTALRLTCCEWSTRSSEYAWAVEKA